MSAKLDFKGDFSSSLPKFDQYDQYFFHLIEFVRAILLVLVLVDKGTIKTTPYEQKNVNNSYKREQVVLSYIKLRSA